MKYNQFYYNFGVYGTEEEPFISAQSDTVSSASGVLGKLLGIFAQSITQSIMSANLIKLWDTTPLNPASWTDQSVSQSEWTDATTPSTDWHDTRT